MNTNMVRDMESCYLVIDEGVELGFQQKMVLHNQIEGILQVEERRIDDRIQYYYHITNRISLREYVNRKSVTAEWIHFVFEEIILRLQKAKGYLLEQDNFVLTIDAIFLNEEGNSIELCFCEGYHTEVRSQMLGLIEFFMQTINYKDEKAVRLTYAVYKCLREDICSFDTMIHTMKDCMIENQREKYEQTAISQQREFQQEPLFMQQELEMPTEVGNMYKTEKCFNIGLIILNLAFVIVCLKARLIFYQYSDKINVSRVLVIIGVAVGINILINRFWNLMLQRNQVEIVDSRLYDEQGDTIVLSNPKMTCYELKREGSNESIMLTKFPFKVGASKELVQGIAAYPGVSKQHIIFNNTDDGVWITDLDSTNGTFLNGELIEPKREYKINKGDKITLGSVTYQFLSYYK